MEAPVGHARECRAQSGFHRSDLPRQLNNYGTTGEGTWEGPQARWRQRRAVAASAWTGEIGPPGPLPKQTRLADFWLPQRGIFSVGETSFEDFDPTRHHAPRPATKGATR